MCPLPEQNDINYKQLSSQAKKNWHAKRLLNTCDNKALEKGL